MEHDCRTQGRPRGGKTQQKISMTLKNMRAHDYPFNFWVGCQKYSEGCKNCYMFLNQTA